MKTYSSEDCCRMSSFLTLIWICVPPSLPDSTNAKLRHKFHLHMLSISNKKQESSLSLWYTILIDYSPFKNFTRHVLRKWTQSKRSTPKEFDESYYRGPRKEGCEQCVEHPVHMWTLLKSRIIRTACKVSSTTKSTYRRFNFDRAKITV